MIQQLTPAVAARLLLTAKQNIDARRLAKRDDTPLHRVADAHLAPLVLALRAAFNVARKKLGTPPNEERAVKALRAALLKVLPPVLLKTMIAGGDAGLGLLKTRLRAAGDVEGHPFYGNQWTNGSGATLTGVREEKVGSYSTTFHSDQGYMSISRHDATEAKLSIDGKAHSLEFSINKVEVPAGERGKGYGRALYELALSHAVAHGAAGLTSVLRNSNADRVWNSFRKEGRVVAGTRGLNSELLLPKSRETGDRSRALAGPLKFRFDGKNPEAAKWAREHGAELAKDLSDTTRDAIKAALADLQEGTGTLEDVMDAVGDESRADLIAQHETMVAASEGQRQAWDQAVENGLLTGDEQRVWIAVGDKDPKDEDECDELDGKTAPLDGEYPDPGGDGPPLHPRCRCTEGIVG